MQVTALMKAIDADYMSVSKAGRNPSCKARTVNAARTFGMS